MQCNKKIRFSYCINQLIRIPKSNQSELKKLNLDQDLLDKVEKKTKKQFIISEQTKLNEQKKTLEKKENNGISFLTANTEKLREIYKRVLLNNKSSRDIPPINDIYTRKGVHAFLNDDYINEASFHFKLDIQELMEQELKDLQELKNEPRFVESEIQNSFLNYLIEKIEKDKNSIQNIDFSLNNLIEDIYNIIFMCKE